MIGNEILIVLAVLALATVAFVVLRGRAKALPTARQPEAIREAERRKALEPTTPTPTPDQEEAAEPAEAEPRAPTEAAPDGNAPPEAVPEPMEPL